MDEGVNATKDAYAQLQRSLWECHGRTPMKCPSLSRRLQYKADIFICLHTL